ncbi:MAG: hypothetical protein ACXW0J_05135 [Nitrososphaeraceae archaeon]
MFVKTNKKLIQKIKFKKVMLNFKKLMALKNKNLILIEENTKLHIDFKNNNNTKPIHSSINILSFFTIFHYNNIKRFRSISYKTLQTYFNYINVLHFLIKKMNLSLLSNSNSLLKKNDIFFDAIDTKNKNVIKESIQLPFFLMELHKFKFMQFPTYLNLIIKYNKSSVFNIFNNISLHNKINKFKTSSLLYKQITFFKNINVKFSMDSLFFKQFILSPLFSKNVAIKETSIEDTSNYYTNSSNLYLNLFNYKSKNIIQNTNLFEEELWNEFNNLKIYNHNSSFLQNAYLKELIIQSKNKINTKLDIPLLNLNLFKSYYLNENSLLYSDIHLDKNSDEVSSQSLGLI